MHILVVLLACIKSPPPPPLFSELNRNLLKSCLTQNENVSSLAEASDQHDACDATSFSLNLMN